MDHEKIINEARDYFDRVVAPDFNKQSASYPKILRDLVYKTTRESFASGWLACFSYKISEFLTDSEADNGTV